jgi:hypothetical protein
MDYHFGVIPFEVRNAQRIALSCHRFQFPFGPLQPDSFTKQKQSYPAHALILLVNMPHLNADVQPEKPAYCMKPTTASVDNGDLAMQFYEICGPVFPEAH